MKSKPLIIEHRARCSRCGDCAEYYSTIMGITYHTEHSLTTENSPKYDMENYSKRGDYPYDYSKLLRENSIGGTVAVSSFIFKRIKDNSGSYRVVISCQCGQSTWMFTGPTSDPNLVNRKLTLTYEIFKRYTRRYRLSGINV